MSGGVARLRAGLRRVRVVAGALGLVAWALASVEGWSAMAYLAGLHGGLGRGMLPALCAAWVLLSVLPCALCGWAAVPALRRLSARRPANWGSALGLCLLCAASALSSYGAARLSPTGAAGAALPEPELLAALRSLRELAPSLPPPAPAGAPASAAKVTCAAPPDAAVFTLMVQFPSAGAEGGSVRGACLQGEALSSVMDQLRSLLLQQARRGALVIDWVSGVQPLSGRHAWIAALELRPGLDGACAKQDCLTPGQLLSESFFSTYRPVPFIPDFQFGVDPARLRGVLEAAPAPGLGQLLRFETRSYVVQLDGQSGSVTPLLRLRRRDVGVTHAEVERGASAAEGYVLGALLPEGRFRYTLEPLTGAADTESFNLARQAGTALVLCELGADSAPVRSAIQRSLEVFRGFERQPPDLPDLVALTLDPQAQVARLGESALPLASQLFCSTRLDAALPAATGGLARLLLELQRPDGGFFPELDLLSGKPRPGPEPLYAAGQALLALVLLEDRQRARPDPALPPLDRLEAAVERAMTYVATDYWSHPLADFFFLEENWHCLAARAALQVHRHAGYEDFCLRYVRFKARLILESEQGADPDFDGGFGFGNLVPPHNTGAAGLAEALAAALSLERARGQTSAREQRLLIKVLGFLLRQQWSPENCFACASTEVIGGLSEHTHSLLTRIDFAQHAWAALGHGAAILGPDLPER